MKKKQQRTVGLLSFRRMLGGGGGGDLLDEGEFVDGRCVCFLNRERKRKERVFCLCVCMQSAWKHPTCVCLFTCTCECERVPSPLYLPDWWCLSVLLFISLTDGVCLFSSLSPWLMAPVCSPLYLPDWWRPTSLSANISFVQVELEQLRRALKEERLERSKSDQKVMQVRMSAAYMLCVSRFILSLLTSQYAVYYLYTICTLTVYFMHETILLYVRLNVLFKNWFWAVASLLCLPPPPQAIVHCNGSHHCPSSWRLFWWWWRFNYSAPPPFPSTSWGFGPCQCLQETTHH